MSGSFRSRIALLPALVALMTMAGCLVAGLGVVDAAIARHERIDGLDAWAGFLAAAERCRSGIAFEASDYSHWDELHQRMPRPPDDWSAINLAPGGKPGSLTARMALDAGGRIQGRYWAGHQGGSESGEEDPLSADDLHRLAFRRDAVFGPIAGRVLLASAQDITASDGSGPLGGRLIAYRYFDDELRQRLTPSGWRLELVAATADAERDPVVRIDGEHLVVHGTLRGGDGMLAVTLRQNTGESRSIRSDTALAMVVAGAVSALAAAGLGALLGWRWLRSLRQLALWCRSHRDGDAGPPPGGEFTETRVLADVVAHLLETESRSQERNRVALERTRAAYAVHQRFIAKLGEQLGEPMHTLERGFADLRRDGASDPSRLEQLEEAFRLVELSLAEALAVNARDHGSAELRVPLHLPTWLDGIARRFATRAQQAEVSIDIDAPDRYLPVDDGELAPVLVHLLSNAASATPAGGRLALSAAVEGGDLVLRVADQGAGFSDELAGRVRNAMARGEVMPGEPGIGFGLATVIDRVARLGGTIVLERTGRTGTVIAVNLPIEA